MPRQKKVDGYADRNYQQKKNLYDSIAQAFQDMKYGVVHTANSWNVPVEQLKGVTMRMVGDTLEIAYHHYEVTTVEGLARVEDTGKDFLKETEKGIKKRFKELTKKTLNLKKISEDRVIEKASRLQADTSWMLGSSRYGYGARPVGRYLVRDSRVYEYSAELE